MKLCPRCQLIKDDASFSVRDKARGALSSMCKSCKTEYNKDWYRQNAASHKVAIATGRPALRQRNRAWCQTLKSTLCCIECGESHSACLDFHHREPAGKDLSIGNAISKGWSIKRLEAEAAKCDVLCANCHRKVHYEERRITEARSATG